MICTESEAMTKWCPQVRAWSQGCSINVAAQGTPSDRARCIGSACMMWVWEDLPTPKPFVAAAESIDDFLAHGAELCEPREGFGGTLMRFRVRRGTCGLIHWSAP